MSTFLACDWGTTNLRAWILDGDGKALDGRDFPLGVSRLEPGEARRRFLDEVRPALQAEALPALLCGMIGSNLGWRAVPYRKAPVGLAELAAGLEALEAPGAPVRIVPGVQGPGLAGAPEVMRGEETQVLGWMALDPDRATGRHVVCHPGTHAKWVVLEDARIVRFLTAMTGELFDILRKHSVLKSEAGPPDPEAFALGLSSAGAGDALSSRLFTARTWVVAGGLAPGAAASYLSGLLIGSETAGLPTLLGLQSGAKVAVVGEPGLCDLYETALTHHGFEVSRHDGDAAVRAGLAALQRHLSP
jgi:2-dehydro-3-deoxygalactonokinase